jgi:biopolymer transport protein ExbB
MDFLLPDLFVRGGWLMYTHLPCSVVALGFFIERLFKLRRSRVLPRGLMQNVNDLILRHKLSDAIYLAQGHPSAMARIYMAALRIWASRARPSRRWWRKSAGGKRPIWKIPPGAQHRLQHRTSAGPVGNGFRHDQDLQRDLVLRRGQSGTLASGISEALLTTAAGLSVAIPTLVGYRFVSSKPKA